MVGVLRRVILAGTVLALAACSIENEQEDEREHRERRVEDERVAADARPQRSDAGVLIDASPVDASPAIDARDYYCNVPEPGPCCCDPVNQEILAPHSDAAITSLSCDFVIQKSRMDAGKYNVLARAVDGTETVLPRTAACSADEPGWTLVTENPRVGRLCPTSCEAFVSGAYTALVVIHGCYAIACPPPP